MAYKTRSNTMKLQRLIDYLKDRGSDLASNLETSAAIFFDDVKPKSKPPIHLLYDSDSGSSYCGEQEDDESWGSDWEEDFGDEEPPDLITEPSPEFDATKPTPTDLKKDQPLLVSEPPPVPPIVRNEAFPQPVDILPLSTSAKVETTLNVEKVELPEHVPVLATQIIKQLPEPQLQEEVNPPPKSKPSKDVGPKVYLSGFHSSKSVPTPLMKFTTHVNIPNSFGATKEQTSRTSSASKQSEKAKVTKKYDEDVHRNDDKCEPLDKNAVKETGKPFTETLPNDDKYDKNAVKQTEKSVYYERSKQSVSRRDTKEATLESHEDVTPKRKEVKEILVSDVPLSTKAKLPEIVRPEAKSSAERNPAPVDNSKLKEKVSESVTFIAPPVVVTQVQQEVKNECPIEKLSSTLLAEDRSNPQKQAESCIETPIVPLISPENKVNSEVVKSPIPEKLDDLSFSRLHTKAASSPNLKYYGRSNNSSLTTINETASKNDATKVKLDDKLELESSSETIVEKSPDKLCVPFSVKRSRSGSILKSTSPSRDDESFLNVSPPKHVHFLIDESQVEPSPAPNPPSVQSPRRHSPGRKSSSPVVDQPQAQAYQAPRDVEVPVVGGQRSRKPTLASQWRKQQEKRKRHEQNLLSRLETFTTWTCDNTTEAEAEHLAAQIAEAGFYYIGLNDSVKCNQCGLILKDWTTSDNPWARHAQKRNDCPFLVEVKGQEWVIENQT